MNTMLSQESRQETLSQSASSGDHAFTMKHQEQKPQEDEGNLDDYMDEIDQ